MLFNITCSGMHFTDTEGGDSQWVGGRRHSFDRNEQWKSDKTIQRLEKNHLGKRAIRLEDSSAEPWNPTKFGIFIKALLTMGDIFGGRLCKQQNIKKIFLLTFFTFTFLILLFTCAVSLSLCHSCCSVCVCSCTCFLRILRFYWSFIVIIIY